MKNFIKKINKENFIFLLFTYTIGSFLGFLRILFQYINIDIKNMDRIPRDPQKLIVVYNHPSYFLDPLLTVLLFFRYYFFDPFKYGPWSTPDKKNFYNRLFMFWLRPRSIAVPRGDKRGVVKALKRMKKILDNRGILNIGAEGGRTSSGNDFLSSDKGKKIRKLQKGVGWLVCQTGADVLLIWFEGTDEVWPNDKRFAYRFWKKITIKIGGPISYSEITKDNNCAESATNYIAKKLLALADEQ